ncbi:MAG: dTMP kinase [Candidatus Vogelbacteria bacterium]|nr:dTMP kinase [Candidatus Vogelbacteria bacterium]
MTRGKFIVLEGGDGTGKSACKEYLQAKLVDHNVVFTHEPGGTEIGQEIREVLLRHRATHFHPLTELLLFAASRAQHVNEKIQPLLAAGQHVICDRFIPSSFAYQVRANERADLEHIFTILHEHAVGDTHPDLYILLDLDPKLGKERTAGRGSANRLDVKDLEFHGRVREGMKEYVTAFHHQIIDASQPLAKVKEAVLRAALSELTK